MLRESQVGGFDSAGHAATGDRSPGGISAALPVSFSFCIPPPTPTEEVVRSAHPVGGVSHVTMSGTAFPSRRVLGVKAV